MSLSELEKHVSKGQYFLDCHQPAETHSEFNRWVSEVSRWLNKIAPESGLSADWASQGSSELVIGGSYYDDPTSWSLFRMKVESRLRWLSNLPLNLKIANFSKPQTIQYEAKEKGRKEIKLNTISRAYIDPDRVNELQTLSNGQFDLCKVIRICEELNVCFAGECYLSMIVLTRALLDHIPPIFECSKFSEVANNYGGSKSFKEAMNYLENTSRKIADHYLHCQIRKSESVPNVKQVDFSNNIDFLLAEIIRILKT